MGSPSFQIQAGGVFSIDHLIDEELHTYNDGRLTENKTAIDNHLKTCTHCKRRMTAYSSNEEH